MAKDLRRQQSDAPYSAAQAAEPASRTSPPQNSSGEEQPDREDKAGYPVEDLDFEEKPGYAVIDGQG